MVICTYCRENFFEDRTWLRSDFREHHSSATAWAESVKQRCGVCTILATHLAKAVFRHLGRRTQHAYSSEELKTSLEKLAVLPVYRVRYHLRHNKGQVFVGFETVHFENGIDLHNEDERINATLLSRQTFIAYDPDSYGKPKDMLDTLSTLQSSTKSEATFLQLKKWLSTCDANHARCLHSQKHSNLDKMPKRLIECTPKMRLVETREINYTGRYMTLSHCWGMHVPLEHRTNNAAELKEEIKWEQLPLTFQNAVEVVRRLGERYLWIDSICIHQGADGDFATEGTRMDDIYGRTYCNIAAIHAKDSRFGLFSERSIDELEPFSVRAWWAGYPKEYHLVRSDYWFGKVLSSVLFSRGWCFQERMLSPRILHFSKNEVMWQCAVNAASEQFPEGLPLAINFASGEESRLRSLVAKLTSGNIDRKTRAALNSIWKLSAENYSRLDLTKEEDKLFALSGLSKVIGTITDEPFHAGLWDFDFVEQLTWFVRDCRNANGDWSARYRPPGSYVAPTWSWLSMSGNVELRERADQHRKYTLEITSEKTTEIELLNTEAPFSKVKNARFKARAMLYEIPFVLENKQVSLWTAELAEGDNSWVKLYPDEPMHLGSLASNSIDKRRHKIFTAVMLVYSDKGHEGMDGYMMAVRSGCEDGIYLRLGLIELRGMDAVAWKRLENRRVKSPTDDTQHTHDIVLV